MVKHCKLDAQGPLNRRSAVYKKPTVSVASIYLGNIWVRVVTLASCDSKFYAATASTATRHAAVAIQFVIHALEADPSPSGAGLAGTWSLPLAFCVVVQLRPKTLWVCHIKQQVEAQGELYKSYMHLVTLLQIIWCLPYSFDRAPDIKCFDSLVATTVAEWRYVQFCKSTLLSAKLHTSSWRSWYFSTWHKVLMTLHIAVRLLQYSAICLTTLLGRKMGIHCFNRVDGLILLKQSFWIAQVCSSDSMYWGYRLNLLIG